MHYVAKDFSCSPVHLLVLTDNERRDTVGFLFLRKLLKESEITSVFVLTKWCNEKLLRLYVLMNEALHSKVYVAGASSNFCKYSNYIS